MTPLKKNVSIVQKKLNAAQKELNAAQKELDTTQKKFDAAQVTYNATKDHYNYTEDRYKATEAYCNALLEYRNTIEIHYKNETKKEYWENAKETLFQAQNLLETKEIREELYEEDKLLLGSVPYIAPISSQQKKEGVRRSKVETDISVCPNLIEGNRSAVIIYDSGTSKRSNFNTYPVKAKKFYNRADINSNGNIVILGWSEACYYLIIELITASIDRSANFKPLQIVVVAKDISAIEIACNLADQLDLVNLNAKICSESSTRQRLNQQLDDNPREFRNEIRLDFAPIENTQYKEFFEFNVALETDQKSHKENIATVTCKQRDFQETVLIEEDIKEANRIIILADKSPKQDRSRDARTVFTALAIYHKFKNKEIRPHIVAEIIESENGAILDDTDIEVVRRNELAGGALATACRHPKLVEIPIDLLTTLKGKRLTFIEISERKRIEIEQDNKDKVLRDAKFTEILHKYLKKDKIIIGYDNPNYGCKSQQKTGKVVSNAKKFFNIIMWLFLDLMANMSQLIYNILAFITLPFRQLLGFVIEFKPWNRKFSFYKPPQQSRPWVPFSPNEIVPKDAALIAISSVVTKKPDTSNQEESNTSETEKQNATDKTIIEPDESISPIES